MFIKPFPFLSIFLGCLKSYFSFVRTLLALTAGFRKEAGWLGFSSVKVMARAANIKVRTRGEAYLHSFLYEKPHVHPYQENLSEFPSHLTLLLFPLLMSEF